MNRRFKAAHRQSGIALLVLLAALVIVSAAILLERLGGQANASATHDIRNATALAEAKAALIAWAVTFPPSAARESTIGNLPYPDRDVDGNYDGMSDCDALGPNDIVLIGRVPRSGEDTASCGVANPLNIHVHDRDGEPLWYAVSRNVLAGVGVAGGPINPDMGGIGRMRYPWIQLRDDQGNPTHLNAGGSSAVAAVIFAPGAVVGNQDRSAIAAANYLDSITIGPTTYDNADADGCPDNATPPCDGDSDGVNDGEEFVVYPNPQVGDMFNDQLVYITVDELMRAAEKRVLGEVELALDAYRAASGVSYNNFPWLSEFRNPRAASSGTATGGSTTYLDDSAADFVADGIEVGDVVVNLNGGSGVVTSVTTTRVNFAALLGGADSNFTSGENYEIRPSFEGTPAPAIRGHLPVHLPGEIFRTSFTATWDLADIDNYHQGTSALEPDPVDIEDYSITVQVNDGRCVWTDANYVNCYGEQLIPNFWRSDLGATMDQRLIQVQFTFPGRNDSGTAVPATITQATASDARRRSVTIDSDGSPAIPALVPVAAPGLPQDLYTGSLAYGDTWTIRVTDTDAGLSGTTLLVIDADTDGNTTVSGIRYDLSVVYDDIDDAMDEVPEWFAENEWHKFIYAGFSGDVVAAGNSDADNNCATPTNSCLSLNTNATVHSTDIPALLISSGAEWTNQDRAIGDCDGDGGGPLTDPADDSFLCAYLDGDTSSYNVSTDILRHGANTLTVPADWYAKDVFDGNFNDQVRIMD